MHPIEEHIIHIAEIDLFDSYNSDDYNDLNNDDFCQYIHESRISSKQTDQLLALPLGQFSEAFCKNSRVQAFLSDHPRRFENFNKFYFRFTLEEYIHSDRSPDFLQKVEIALLQLRPNYSYFDSRYANKKAGTYLMSLKKKWVQELYLLEDEPLTHLFQKHFPAPPIGFFKDVKIPRIVQNKYNAINETMKKIDFKKIEPFIIKAQRRARMKKRLKEEHHRITLKHKSYFEFCPEGPTRCIEDANTPYKPKCDTALSTRIMAMANKVTAFSTAKHVTAEKSIQSIFDDGLYGQRTLEDLYMDFSEGCLQYSDVPNGDLNSICLGPQEICNRLLYSHNKIIIEFNLPKLIKNKPCAFYKQMDLEFLFDKTRKVSLGDETLFFSHTENAARPRIPDTNFPSYRHFKTYDKDGNIKEISSVKKTSFVSYNLEQMHAILTLNFFRFIDNMYQAKHLVYPYIARLTDEELFEFLTDLEKNMTDTAEFNIYGAHQIDISTIINITSNPNQYTLNLPKFIDDLNQGNINALREARSMIPGLFQSYRFLDYLLLHIKDPKASCYLDDLRKQCQTPSWIKYTPLSTEEKFEPCWELNSKPNTLYNSGPRF